MFLGSLRADLRLTGMRSLKEKRSVIRPILAALRTTYQVSAAETGNHDLLGRAEIGIGLVSGEVGHIQNVLQASERLLADRDEIELLSVRQRVWNDDDE